MMNVLVTHGQHYPQLRVGVISRKTWSTVNQFPLANAVVTMGHGREHVSLHGDSPRQHHPMHAMASSKCLPIMIVEAMILPKWFLVVTITPSVLPNVKQ
jgi:hypothetical protein